MVMANKMFNCGHIGRIQLIIVIIKRNPENPFRTNLDTAYGKPN